LDDLWGVFVMDLGCNRDPQCLEALDRQAVAWSMAVLRNAMEDVRRRERRLREHELLILDAPAPGSEDGEPDETASSQTADPGVPLEERAVGDVAAMEILSVLTARERVAVTLLATGYSEREAGQWMGVTDRAIRKLVARARQRLLR